MKKFLVSISVLGSFFLYGIYQKLALIPQAITSTPSPTNPVTNTNTNTNNSTTNNSNSIPTNTPPSSTVNSSGYKDGTYTGSQGNAYYGYVQVQTTISGGKITDVQFLQYPNDRRTSQMINSQAMPLLKNEAIQAQSANVDIVSGATDTSMAFIESLGAALQSAK